MSKIVDLISEILPNYAAQCDVEIIDIEYKKGFNGMELIIYIDNDADGGISLEDCEKFHRLIDPVLDEIDPTDNQPYQLSVSSPGLDRPLKNERDYAKALGSEVNVSLFKKLGDYKKFVATLISYDLSKGDIVVKVMDKKSEELTLNIKDIAVIKPEIKF